MAASSSSFRPLKHVFLSGEDVGGEFIRDFIRSQLEDGDEFTLFDRSYIDLRDAKDESSIEEMILGAIRDSDISIVVFTEHNASWPWFLTELLEIWKCKKNQGQKVKPIYCGVDPSDVLNQVGKFGEALRETSAKNTEFKYTNWKQVLNDVAGGEEFIRIRKLEKFDITANSSSRNEETHSLLPVDIEPSLSQISKSQWFTRIVGFLVFLSFVTEITSFVSEILSEHFPIHERSFTILSFTMSILSVLICLIQVLCQARDYKAIFRCERHIPWFYYESHDKLKISGSHTDRVLLFCALGELIVWTINFTFNRQELDRPIPTSIMPVLFGLSMVVSVFFRKKYMEKPIILANLDQNDSRV